MVNSMQTPNLEDHSLSDVCGHLLNISTGASYKWKLFLPSPNLRTHCALMRKDPPGMNNLKKGERSEDRDEYKRIITK
jgi:hypothetical protein